MDANRVLYDQTVLVRGGKIAATGSAIPVPDDATVIARSPRPRRGSPFMAYRAKYARMFYQGPTFAIFERWTDCDAYDQ